jgi:hypothetical protein
MADAGDHRDPGFHGSGDFFINPGFPGNIAPLLGVEHAPGLYVPKYVGQRVIGRFVPYGFGNHRPGAQAVKFYEGLAVVAEGAGTNDKRALQGCTEKGSIKSFNHHHLNIARKGKKRKGILRNCRSIDVYFQLPAKYQEGILGTKK